MAEGQRHIHDPAKAEEFARALGLQIGGAGHPFVGNWSTKGLYAYRSGQYRGMAYFGTGGTERNRLDMPHESEKYRPWNRYDPDIPVHIREKLIELEDDDSTSIGQPSRNLTDGGVDLSGIWQSFERATNAGPVDRYEFRRNGERYYVVRPPGGASNESDYFTFDGVIGRHVKGPTNKMLPSGDLHWDIDGWKYVSRREGAAGDGGSGKAVPAAEGENSISVVSRETTEDSRVVTPLRTGWYRMEHADGSFIERARVHQDERNTSTTKRYIAKGDHTGDVLWYVEGNTVKVPKFGSTGTIQADGNITWSPGGTKAVYEGNAGDEILEDAPGKPAQMTEESTKNVAKNALIIGITLFSMGLPLLIIGSTSTGGDKLAMLIPGAVMVGIGAFATVVAAIRRGFGKRATTSEQVPASKIVSQFKGGNIIHFETDNAAYLIKDEDLADEGDTNEPFWEIN